MAQLSSLFQIPQGQNKVLTGLGLFPLWKLHFRVAVDGEPVSLLSVGATLRSSGHLIIESASVPDSEGRPNSSHSLNLSDFPFCHISLTLARRSALLLKIHVIRLDLSR